MIRQIKMMAGYVRRVRYGLFWWMRGVVGERLRVVEAQVVWAVGVDGVNGSGR